MTIEVDDLATQNGATADQSAASPIRFFSPRELREHTPPEPAWVWDGYFARGWLTIVGGKPKIGKSTLTFAAAVASALRLETFLGRRVIGGPVVIITEEVATTALAKLPDLADIRVLTREHAWPKPPLVDLIAAGVEEAKQIDAVMLVLDSFAFWAGLGRDDEKDSGGVQPALDLLLGAAAAGVAVPLIHHQRKSGGEDGDAIRGAARSPVAPMRSWRSNGSRMPMRTIGGWSR